MMLLYYLSGMMFFIISMFMFILSMWFMLNKLIYFLEWNVYSMNSINLNMYMYIDWVLLLFLFMVLFISSMIMLYCSEYMNHDNYYVRFYYLVLLFILSMILMVLSPNMISILIGWDGLGLISYCLVIYYQNYSSFNSGMLTVLLNRIGDVTILMSISLMMMNGSWNFLMLNKINMLMMLMVVMSAFTKSAQFPFSSWLPAAMAAPTPVSSLVHSSTLVTAGVYLLIRFHYLLFNNSTIMMYIMLSGIITMLMSGFSANLEFDIKKIIAFSTLSQLGLMMMIYGIKNWELSYFHLIIHAMFKSMMFMCSGVLIHSMSNIQDIRFMGKLKSFYPMTFSMLVISNLSLCGMPFMSGFYSKDQILEMMMMMNMNLMTYLLMLLATGLTVSYSIRMLMYLMNKELMMLPMLMMKDYKLMNYPMVMLMIMSIFLGSLLNLILFNNIENIFMLMYEKLIIIFICTFFIIMSMMNSKIKFLKFYMMKYFFGKMWFLNNFTPMIILLSLLSAKDSIIDYEKGWSEIHMKNLMILLNFKVNKFDKINNSNNIVIMLFSMSIITMIMVML
uniref:NADH-ubiquinone oxidoreductase chain 5 n=1 Tax=Anisopteromalus calandrae TaxID=76800 RepID=A0A8E5J5S2_9HYME|nr:NADH dehydrogenase subunit 5 [Anisopteromalus calandrae]QUX32902.1 NADH dehydrogenase subunit 5 [Anisopteromalus calandrae]